MRKSIVLIIFISSYDNSFVLLNSNSSVLEAYRNIHKKASQLCLKQGTLFFNMSNFRLAKKEGKWFLSIKINCYN